MDYLKAFLVGGIICVIGQILIDKTKLTPARILVTFVCASFIAGFKVDYNITGVEREKIGYNQNASFIRENV